uniref:U-box domain-containing protein n=2 Tax=Oryza sativa subsp. japonica TaxID=39947 RepID=A0A5S6R9K9_ORYSJ|nr:Hypothetical protein [Oryza sativa Japonica Group]AAM46054.1 Hypothetical protein [Oryza sativa Japonica Group]AAP52193.1 hypothetical protein LOC_Os10g06670 [Oryza sativa Japonica Group]
MARWPAFSSSSAAASTARLRARRGGDDHICGYAEGSLSLVAHPTGLAAVACAATRLSAAGTKSAVRVMHAMARHSATPAVLQEMLAVGVGARLLFLVQVGASGEQTRARASNVLARWDLGTGGNNFLGHEFTGLYRTRSPGQFVRK